MPGNVRIKICGINAPVAFDTAIAAGADWIGFVFFPPSPRYVTPAQAADLSARSPGGPPRVGLFVDPTPETIAAALDVVRLDILQLYGGRWTCRGCVRASACGSGTRSASLPNATCPRNWMGPTCW